MDLPSSILGRPCACISGGGNQPPPIKHGSVSFRKPISGEGKLRVIFILTSSFFLFIEKEEIK